METVKDGFSRRKQELIWDNRMIENRLAVAQQLSEASRIMEIVAEDLYDIIPAELWNLRRKYGRHFRKRHIIVKQVWVMDRAEGRQSDLSHHAGQKRSVYFRDRSMHRFLSEVCEYAYGFCTAEADVS